MCAERYMKDEMELWEEPNLDDEVLEEEEEGDTSLNSQGDQPESNHSVENDRERVRMEKVHLKRGAELKTGIKHKKQKQT